MYNKLYFRALTVIPRKRHAMPERKSCAVFITALVMPLAIQASYTDGREWSDKDKNYTQEAELVSFNPAAGTVKLRKPDGDTVSVAISKLCTDDVEFIRSWTVQSPLAHANKRLAIEAIDKALVSRKPPKAAEVDEEKPIATAADGEKLARQREAEEAREAEAARGERKSGRDARGWHTNQRSRGQGKFPRITKLRERISEVGESRSSLN